jgi:ATP-dependent DNA helicase RecG
MSDKLQVFVSSVQKELEDERVIVQNLLTTDPFLAAHCSPVLYEFEPASPDKALDGCLKALDVCQVYLLIIAAQYGTLVGTPWRIHERVWKVGLTAFRARRA